MIAELPSGLDSSRLVKPKQRGSKIVAQCPACAAAGGDKSGEHLVIFEDGRWGCVAYAGDVSHRREIATTHGRDVTRPVCVPASLCTGQRRRTLTLPPLRVPTVGQLAGIADLRGLPFIAGLELAVRAGVLWIADLNDGAEVVTAWVLTDGARISAQGRRLDGKPWFGIGGAKAKTLPGSQAAWPIGSAAIGDKPFVALCEGGPDALAAWTLAWWHGKAGEVAPVCIAGAGQRIHPDALPFFRGKGVFTFPHRDAAGERAQAVWTKQLREAGASWVKDFDLSPAKDLNDWLFAAVHQMEEAA